MEKMLRFRGLIIAVCLIIFAVSIGTAYYQSQVENSGYNLDKVQEKIIENPSRIPPRDMSFIVGELSANYPDTKYDVFVTLVTTGQVYWVAVQTDAKDRTLAHVVFYIKDGGPFLRHFTLHVNTEEFTGLKNWAIKHNVDPYSVAVDPTAPKQRILSPQILIMLALLCVFAGFFTWSIFWGPLSGDKKFLRAQKKRSTENSTHFNDVAGVDEAKDELHIVIRQLRRAKKFKKLGFLGKKLGPRMRNGLLLVGPPGTGKTLLARAMANEADVPFFQVSGTEFVQMFVGVGASRIRSLFEEAKKQAPCIVFIDEIDSVAQKMTGGLGTGGDREYEGATAELLVQMDGFDKDTQIIVIGATNRPEVLNPAILRPGRIDLQVVVDLPDIDGRVDVLKVHTNSLLLSSDVDLKIISKQTPGLSGADLENLVNEAYILADLRLDEESDEEIEITMDDFEKSIDKISYGPAKKTPMTDEDKYRFAVHESAHLIIGYDQEDAGGSEVHKISIVQRTRIGGHVKFLSDDSVVLTKNQCIARLAAFIGGFVAEEMYCGRNVSTSPSSDLNYITNFSKLMIKKWGMGDRTKLGLRTFGGESQSQFLKGSEISEVDCSPETALLIDEEIKNLTTRAEQTAKRILFSKRERFEYIVKELLERETIKGEELREILEGPIPSQK